ncbi:hypothetical protein B0H16DRAFT_1745852 [Mycena metata]|uniref:NmrA-like domain-containing protein n=1 Tax=Mycena metata TaxID=1033252 RepID=A0AAD7H0L0_9AGAR|nr:hypothetical protein B0H16DRAFT_1745852 [Mycena metata]
MWPISLFVLVIGASGSVGEPLMKQFQHQRFRRVAIMSAPSKAHKFSAARSNGIELFLGSFLDFKSYEGSTLQRMQPAMIEAAVAGGVRRFYPSEFGIDFDRADVQQLRFFRDRIVMRDHLAATAKAHPDFRYTLMVVGQFSQWAHSKHFGLPSPPT